MIRIGISLVLALSVGVLCGVLWAPRHGNEDPTQALGVRDALRAEITALRVQVEECEPQVEQLSDRNEALRDRVDALLATLDSAQNAETYAPWPPEIDDEEDWIEAPQPEGDEKSISFQDFIAANPSAAEAMRRRRDGAKERQERFDTFLEELAGNAQDEETAERIAAIADYQRYMRELGRDMAGAESEEERAEFATAWGEARREARALLREQQDMMFKTVAEAHGIQDREEQATFAREVRGMMRSPFFSMSWASGGGTTRGWRPRPERTQQP